MPRLVSCFLLKRGLVHATEPHSQPIISNFSNLKNHLSEVFIYLVQVAHVILSMAAWSTRCFPEGTS